MKMTLPSPFLPAPLRPLTLADERRYRTFFAQDTQTTCYGNSLLYLTQACRGLGLGALWDDGDVLVSVGMHRGHYVVVRPLGTLDTRFLRLLEVLRTTSGRPVFLKKLAPDQVTYLQTQGRFVVAAHYDPRRAIAVAGAYPWDTVAVADDDTYPELIVDPRLMQLMVRDRTAWRQSMLEQHGFPLDSDTRRSMWKDAHEFCRRIRHFAATGRSCWLEPYMPAREPAVRELLAAYFGPTRTQDVAAYEQMFRILRGPSQGRYRSWVVRVEGEARPVGWYCVEVLDPGSAGLYAGLTRRLYPGLPEQAQLCLYAQLEAQELVRVNIGGSETVYLHRFKRRGIVVEARHVPLLVYGVEPGGACSHG